VVISAGIGWTTISALATAGGTLVLAIATFASVRSANRAARTAEQAFRVGLRPVLFGSRLQDPPQKIRWGDDYWGTLPGGLALLDVVDKNLYMAMSIRNVGSGIGVLHSWRAEPLARPGSPQLGAALQRPPLESFRPQLRDLYVPPGDIGFWQAAIRDPEDPDYALLLDSMENQRGIFVDLIYGDHEGGQRTIGRFVINRRDGEEGPTWMCYVIRHWNLDRPDPR